MWTYVEIDGKLYVTKEDYLNIVKYYENSLSSERNGAKEEIEGLRKENDKLKIHIEAKDKAYMDLLADYNYLKARIKKTERAFLKYEEKQKRLLGDLDMVVMNR